MAFRAKKSLTDTLFETNFQTKVASELWLNLGGREYRLVGKVVRLGRALDNDIVLEDRSCSRYHAMITIAKDGYLLEDLKSRNGVKVNNKSISKVKLSDNDQVQIGDLKGLFFLKSKSAVGAKFSTEETGMGHAEVGRKAIGQLENLKQKWNELPPKKRMAFAGLIPVLLFFGFVSLSGTKESSQLVAAQEPISGLLDKSQIVDQAVSSDDFNQCLEFEDLGNLRKARDCFSTLPLNQEVFIALNRVIARQQKLTDLRFQEGQRAYENYYFDMAILKWQEVLLIADDSSELRAKAEAGIRDAEQRKLQR